MSFRILICLILMICSFESKGDIDKNNLDAFLTVLQVLENDYVDKVEEKKLVEGSLAGMLTSLDPYSEYYTQEEFKDLVDRVKGEFGGLGIEFAFEKGVKVISPIEDTPAYRAGIKSGDFIVMVNGKNIDELSRTEAVKMMRGAPGSKVKLTVVRDGEKKPLEFEITRELIKFPTIKYFSEKGLFYVKILSFTQNTTEVLLNALDDIKNNNIPIKGVIVDVRGNPGGDFEQAISVSSLFLEKGIVVKVKGRSSGSKDFEVMKNVPKMTSVPLIVLIDRGSASASEIFAGAIQDHHRGVIMGTKSYGKGTVQHVYRDLPKGYGGMKFTTANFYTPLGKKIQSEGVRPDIEVHLIELTAQEREQLQQEYDKMKGGVSGKKLTQELWDKLYKKDNVIKQGLDTLKVLNLMK